ncbi:MAG: prepilin-type N-terminal cleavage/methylation domain-containing protein [Verrucomicrobiota bacterium]
MKLNTTHIVKRKPGMTLLELTVVILVLLSLISILFIGARAWKKGSDRAANILNIRNVQQAVRAHANVRELAVTAPLLDATIMPTDGTGYIKPPTPPAAATDAAYIYGTTVPAIGTLYVTNPSLGDGAGEYWYDTTPGADPDGAGPLPPGPSEATTKTGDW